MSVWSHISGVINLDSSVTEDDLLAFYELISHHLVGSEGGLNISFTRTERNSSRSSSARDYKVERFTRVGNIVIQGHLRSFDEDKLESALGALKQYITDLNTHYTVRQASFILECDQSEYYYHLAFVKNRIRTKKVKVKFY